MSKVADDLHRQLGLTDDEFDRIVEILGRAPNRAELAMYSVMWSEHCSYKSSRLHLKQLPSEGPEVLIGPGEGAGVIKVDGVAVALRLESHNHPSFVEPVQGAATGIGGIVRDVLSMGARPVALLDPLRFGPLPSDPASDPATAERNRSLVEGVVSGISSYGNCLGIPTVGGEVVFEPSYSGNPLVNVMCVGVAPVDRIRLARAHGPGNKVLLLGSSTGRDGIGGVSVLASATFDESAHDLRPSVQVGDPFTEKLLIETCLELMDSDLVVGVQDLGGAGLCCATSESAARAGTGMRIELDAVPRREPGMEPFEVLTSESQERMLVIVKPEHVVEALGICEKWGLGAAVIGEVTDTGRLEVVQAGEVVADVPAGSLGNGPLYDRPSHKPEWVEAISKIDVNVSPTDIGQALLAVVSSPNIASKRWVYEQYDHMVMLGTVVKPGSDAAVLRLEGAPSRIALTVDGNGRYCHIDPRAGSAHSVAEAARNLSALGARPVAITNCLNFGNPERPEVMWQFKEAIAGIAEACDALSTPVTGGNVSFYNESAEMAIYPTPIIGMVGILAHEVTPPGIGFSEGGVVAVVGETFPELGGSEYARSVLGLVGGQLPSLDLGLEATTGEAIRLAIASGLLTSVHDISSGGIGVALAESVALGSTGALVTPPDTSDTYLWLFSESASRYLVSFDESNLERLRDDFKKAGLHVIGRTGGDRLIVEGALDLGADELRSAYTDSFARAMSDGR